MAKNSYLFASESVSEGHPDKVCDMISDAVLDTFLAADPYARVACETLVTTQQIVLAGEVRGPASITKDVLEQVARDTVRKIGYEQNGFHWKTCDVMVLLHSQSADIAMGVDSGENKDEGAGDQGIMFGYACRETDALMPAPIYYAHKILRDMAQARHSGTVKGLGPDAKSQISLLYENGKPVRATSIVVSTQHDEDLSSSDVEGIVRPFISKALPKGWLTNETDFYINPTGRFVIGGPDGDAGLTGRKIIVDTYGGMARHGGGAFSGKDPSKVDRSAAYAARWVAKNVVAAGAAERCEIQVAYAIGVAHPISIMVETFGTENADPERIAEAVRNVFDLRPAAIIRDLELRQPIYKATAAYGHFGRTGPGFTWERTDRVGDLKSALGL